MPFTPNPPFPKSKGDALRSEDWNQLAKEVQRLGIAKLDSDGDDIAGSLTISGALAIGRTSPQAPLHLAGGNWDVSQGEGDLKIGDDTYCLKIGVATGGGGAGNVRIRAQGGTNRLMLGGGTGDGLTVHNANVGIGTITPDAKLTVAGALKFSTTGTTGTLIFHQTNESGTPDGDGFRLRYENRFFGDRNVDALVIEKTDRNNATPDGGIAFVNTGNDGVVKTALAIRGNGDIGIGTNDPTTKLDIRGTVSIGSSSVFTDTRTPKLDVKNGAISLSQTRLASSPIPGGLPMPVNEVIKFGVAHEEGKYFHDSIRGEPNLYLDAKGRVLIKEGFTTRGLDVAERFKVLGTIQASHVVVLDDQEETVRLCNRPYDSRLAGIISTNPGFILGMEPEQMPVALCGRVPCQVDADIAPIAIGDLLTTSATPGHAQKVLDIHQATGAILGKALGSLAKGKGTMLVLVMLR
jgi:hypothetical protein